MDYQNRRFKILRVARQRPILFRNGSTLDGGVFDEDTWHMDSAEDSIDSQPRRSTRKATSNPLRVNGRHPCPAKVKENKKTTSSLVDAFP
jgi:hypothetical protein